MSRSRPRRKRTGYVSPATRFHERYTAAADYMRGESWVWLVRAMVARLES